jgi:sugar lactone lactonase YvrE
MSARARRPASRPRPGSPRSLRLPAPIPALAAALLALALTPPGAAGQQLPDTVRIQETGLHPEGVEWDAEGDRFLVSSVTRGTVTAVRDDGSHTTLVEDPDVEASIGVHLDADRGRLLVASSHLEATRGEGPGYARLGVYDLESGERIHMVELGSLHPEGRHFANDITVGPDGTAYVTDSFSPVIYRVTPEGEASIFLEDERLGGDGFGLNGIDYHPDGYLLVAMAGRRALYRIPVEAPSNLHSVELPEPFSADGLTLRGDGGLVAVATTGSGEGRRSEALLLRSGDGWETARIADRAPAPGGTTAAVREGAVYVVNPRFGEMGGEEPPSVFRIYRAGLGR